MSAFNITALSAIGFKMVPLYLVILLGFVAGTRLNARKETVASLLIYIIAPFVIFHGTATTRLTPGILSLPVLFFTICCALAFAFLAIGSLIWGDSRKNILAFTAGTGNTGYFGLPVAFALFNKDVLGVMVLSILGFVLYENTVGFYITAKGNHTGRESVMKVLRLPTIYAFLLGLAVNIGGIPLGGETYRSLAESFRGAYTILGMMIIGLGIAGMRRFEFDGAFLGLSFLAKFIVWPIVVSSVVFIDAHSTRIYDIQTHRIMTLLSIVPLAANTVAVATELRTEPEKSALAVLLSTAFALLYIPVTAAWFLA